MKKKELASNLVFIISALLLCFAPLLHRGFELKSDIGLIAAGVAMLVSTITENRVIRLTVGILALLAILYSYL